jgi:hypothetical protein
MVGALEKEYGFELDMSGIETEEMTLLGPIARFVSLQSAQLGSKPPS